MAERKNTQFDRPGGYASPRGSNYIARQAAAEFKAAGEVQSIVLPGDAAPPHEPTRPKDLKPAYSADDPDTRLYVGDCRDLLYSIPECANGEVDLIFADPPFNWDVPYDGWKDGMPRHEYERFTYDWLDGCISALAPHGALWVNIPDDTAAEVVMHLKRRGLTMINWCIWHYRFGQHRDSAFISSKVHVLYFVKEPTIGDWKDSAGNHVRGRIWNGNDILELSDRASIYSDPRTMAKSENKGLRVPMDVWYGKYWGRIQGNNKERRHKHHNQIPEIYLERVIKACSHGPAVTNVDAFTSRDREGAEKSASRQPSAVSMTSQARRPRPSAQSLPSLVLDPFCGSGTTSTVARALGRRSITIEFSEKNASASGGAWERITKVGMVKRAENGPASSAIFKKRNSQTMVKALVAK